MEKTLVIIFALCFFFSCSTTTNEVSGNEILGHWTWIESSGGLAGTQETPETSQQVLRLEISENSIKRIVDGELESNRGYTIKRKKSIVYGEEKEMIIYDNGFREIFITTGNQLTLIGDCNDCYTSVYTRTGSIKQ